MEMYAPPLLDEIRVRVELVDLAKHPANLKKAGPNWKGVCPFHSEKSPREKKTPSRRRRLFLVNPAKGVFHCFGCGANGDVFGFVMRQDKVSFPEAVRRLAKIAGVELWEMIPFYADTIWSVASVARGDESDH